jgi:hypothetical protein
MKVVLRSAAALHLLCASTLATAGNLPGSGFWVGYNEAWFGDNYGTWLTSNPFYGAPSRFPTTLSVIDTWFAGMAKGKAKIVRIWLFPSYKALCSANRARRHRA